LNVYYLDEPLDDEDIEFLIEILCEWESLKIIQEINQIRVPSVFPNINKNGKYDEDIGERIELIKNNLFKAGIEKDIGTQITWIHPKDLQWGAAFTTAIGDITGYLPYVIQRWFFDDDTEEWVRGEPRIMDSHGMFGLKKQWKVENLTGGLRTTKARALYKTLGLQKRAFDFPWFKRKVF